MSKLRNVISLTFIGLVSFVATAWAAAGETDLSGTARMLFDYVMSGRYVAGAAASLVLAVALAKRYAPGKMGEWLHSDVGGSLATFVMSLGGALMTATAGSVPWSWGMLTMSAKVAFFAAGGYVLLKKALVDPFLRPLAAKCPAWMQPAFGIMFWLFDKKVSANEALAASHAAGSAAVALHAASGANGVVDKQVDL